MIGLPGSRSRQTARLDSEVCEEVFREQTGSKKGYRQEFVPNESDITRVWWRGEDFCWATRCHGTWPRLDINDETTDQSPDSTSRFYDWVLGLRVEITERISRCCEKRPMVTYHLGPCSMFAGYEIYLMQAAFL